MMGVLHPTRQKTEGKNLGRKHLDMELSEKRGAFARKRRREKRAERMATRMKHKAARARSRLDELTFGPFNVHTAAVDGVNCIGHINALLRPCAVRSCDVIKLQETKRDGTSEIVASGYRVYFSGDCRRSKAEKGSMGLD